jgi:hypothetical protein
VRLYVVAASDAAAGDKFGIGVALSANGDTLAVSAPYQTRTAMGVNGDQAQAQATGNGNGNGIKASRHQGIKASVARLSKPSEKHNDGL